MQPRDGAPVSYIGWSMRHEESLVIGDAGIVLSSGETGSWVQWRTGAITGEVTLTSNEDIVTPTEPLPDLDAEVEGEAEGESLFEVFEESGPLAVAEALMKNEMGQVFVEARNLAVHSVRLAVVNEVGDALGSFDLDEVGAVVDEVVMMLLASVAIEEDGA